MKLAIAIWEYSRTGGLPRHASQLATGLNGRGHDVTVFAHEHQVTPADEGITFERYGSARGPLLWKMWMNPALLTRFLRERVPDFDAVIVIGMPCLAPVVMVTPGIHAAWHRGLMRGWIPSGTVRRIFETVRPFHWPVLFWERRMIRGKHPRRLIVPSEQTREQYLRIFDVPPELMEVIPNGVELEDLGFSQKLRDETRAELGIPDGTLLILNVAGRIFQKGLDLMIDGLNRLDDGEWHAVIAGFTSKRLERMCSSLLRRGRITLTGKVPAERTRALYCAADVMVFPSRLEPWGLVVTEAIACGLPVLCSINAGAKDAIVEGVNGLLIRDLTDGREIARLLHDELGRIVRDGSREAIAATVQWLDHHLMAERLEKVLRSEAGDR